MLNRCLLGESSHEMEQEEGNSASREKPRTLRRFRENAEVLGSGQTYKDIILGFVKSWLQDNQVA